MNYSKLLYITWLGCMTTQATGAVTFYNVNNYKWRINNPFYQNSSIDNVYIEDFESESNHRTNVLSTPYATGWNGWTTGSLGWGVQEDYSPTDPDGGMGWYWTDAIRSESAEKPPIGIHFDFTPDAYGRYPEYVGAALRGFGILGASSNFNTILVYDASGNEVTNGDWLIPKPPWNPDQPIEDLFLNFEGIHVPGGISRIQFRDFQELDHLTYGYAPIPEPSTISLGGVAAVGLLRRRARAGL